MPEAIIAFVESTSVEDAIRLAISLGGDADTLAAIAGGIAQAFYGGVPDHIAKPVKALLPEEFLSVIAAFEEKYPHRRQERPRNRSVTQQELPEHGRRLHKHRRRRT